MKFKTGKLEPRGKYKGAKWHLEEDVCRLLIDLFKNPTPQAFLEVQTLAVKVGEKLVDLEKECPNLLKDRTPEEIKAELENEFNSAKAKLEAMAKGKDWKEVKVDKEPVVVPAKKSHGLGYKNYL